MSGTKDEQAGGALAPGTLAPDFKLHSTPDQFVSLSDFHGASVILVFYPADWSPVCGDQMALYNEILPEFRRFKGAQLSAFRSIGVPRQRHLFRGHSSGLGADPLYLGVLPTRASAGARLN